jgi:hypothetical protein
MIPFFKNKSKSIINNRPVDILILIVLVIIVHRGWFKPGMLDYGDLWSLPKEALVKFFSVPYIWFSFSHLFSFPEHPYIGQYFSNIFMYPVQQLLPGLIAFLGFNSDICLKITFFLPYFFLLVFSMYYFTYVLFKKRLICFFATLFFVFNIFLLLGTACGVIISMIANALAPLVLAFFVKGLRQKHFQNGILAGIFLSISIAYYPPSAYLTIWAALLFFIVAFLRKVAGYDSGHKNRIFKLFGYLILVLSVPFVLNFYWILPAMVTKSSPVVFNPGYEHVGWVYTLSYAKLIHTISIYGTGWPPKSPTFPVIPLQYFAIPIIVLIGILARLKDRNVRLLAIIAIIGVFFAKGTNKPFGDVYAWFFKYFPGGNMFRVPGKFTCLTILAYPPLLGLGIDYLSNVLEKIELKTLRRGFKIATLKPLFVTFIFSFIIYLTFPAITGKLGGSFEAKQIPKEYEVIKEFIKNKPPHSFRTYWYPLIGRYAFFSQEYPIISAYYLRDNAGYFLTDTCNPEVFKKTKYIAKILGILNLKYCFLPLEKEYLYNGRDFYLNTLGNQLGLKKINIGKNIDCFENQYLAPRFFVTEHGALVVGGLKSLFSLVSFEGMDLSRWAIFFADELKEDSKGLLGDIETIVFYNRDITDLTLALVGKEYRVDLTKYVIQRDDNPAIGRWVKGGLPPVQSFDGVITQNPSGIIYRHMNIGNSIPSKLNTAVPINIKENALYEIWLRVAKGPDRGRLSVIAYEDIQMKKLTKQILNEEDLKDEYYSLQWIKAGTFYLKQGRYFFQVIHHPGLIGMVDQFIIIPKKTIDSLRQDILKILQSKDIVIIKEPGNFSCDIFIPEDGNYRIAVDIGSQDFSGNLTVKFNGNIIKEEILSNKDKEFWVEAGPVKSAQGLSNILISISGEGKLEPKKIVLYKSNIYSTIKELFKVREDLMPVTWQMVNPTKYRIKLETKRPAYLVFSEGYDNRWLMSLEKPISSIISYGMVNSFFIKNPMNIDTTIEFYPQKYVYAGLWVTCISLVLMLVYLFYKLVNYLIPVIKNKEKS